MGVSIALIGLGNVGTEISKRIVELKLPRDKKISNLYINTKNFAKAYTFINNTLQNIKNKVESDINTGIIELEEINSLKPQIVINCASNCLEEIINRREMGIRNLELTRKITSYIPRDSLYIIVTNHPLMLSEDAVITNNRDPALTIGLTHIDTLRARAKIRSIIKEKPEYKDSSIDLSDIFVIGSHDYDPETNENEMILATQSRIGWVMFEDIKFLETRIKEIEDYVAQTAITQKKQLGDTKSDTALAIEDIILSAINEKRAVTAAVLCDFKSDYFSLDKDYDLFQKPSKNLYMSLPIKFKNFKAEFNSIDWFQQQTKQVKERFYKIALKQEMFMNKLREEGKIKGYACKIFIPPILPQKKRDYEGKKSFKKILLIATGSSIFLENKIFREFKEGVRKIGYEENNFYVGLKKTLYFEELNGLKNCTYEYPLDYSGSRGINSLIFFKNNIYVAHSDLGILVVEEDKLKRVYFEGARSLIKKKNRGEEKIFFISINKEKNRDDYKIINFEGKNYEAIFKSNKEIIKILPLEDLIMVIEKEGIIHIFDDNFQRLDIIKFPNNAIYCAEIFEKNIVLGTNKGAVLYNIQNQTRDMREYGAITHLASSTDFVCGVSRNKIIEINSGEQLTGPKSIYPITSICFAVPNHLPNAKYINGNQKNV